ncbi:hypothetical protein [Halopelagius longus]|uniref:Uncharacterized protein n=1 Tax=Halopelagius longus TaxID=1236180 RepID=A0A1H0XNL0_9EURY|nr:hypothetical protein [Halopelagius longus]SDQ04507.1 hypothetical protein SAMN05216278_0038 [Halopelagius longus]
MRSSTLAVLAALAILLLTVGGVTAHGGNGTASDHDSSGANASAADWATWMERHMTEHMGADATARMQERTGTSYEEMGEHLAGHRNGSMMGGMMNGSTTGMGCH